VDEQEHPAEAEDPGPSAPDATPPVTEPATAGPERRRRGEGARKVLTSRAAGWVVAGAVVALWVVLAASSSATVLQVGAGRSFRLVPAGGRTEIVLLAPNAALRASWVQIHGNAPPGSVTIEGPAAVQPGSVRVALPANASGALRVEVPAVVLPAGRAQVPAGRWVQVPARVWVQVPAGAVAPAPAASPARSTAH